VLFFVGCLNHLLHQQGVLISYIAFILCGKNFNFAVRNNNLCGIAAALYLICSTIVSCDFLKYMCYLCRPRVNGNGLESSMERLSLERDHRPFTTRIGMFLCLWVNVFTDCDRRHQRGNKQTVKWLNFNVFFSELFR